MKVYVLDSVGIEDGTTYTNIIGVYVTPKVAKKHLEKHLGFKTKGMWFKGVNEDCRFMHDGNTTYTITEFDVVKK